MKYEVFFIMFIVFGKYYHNEFVLDHNFIDLENVVTLALFLIKIESILFHLYLRKFKIIYTNCMIWIFFAWFVLLILKGFGGVEILYQMLHQRKLLNFKCKEIFTWTNDNQDFSTEQTKNSKAWKKLKQIFKVQSTKNLIN